MEEAEHQTFPIQSDQVIKKLSKNKTSTIYNKNESMAKDNFVQALSIVGSEHRYGKILNQDEDVQFLINLFTDIHHNCHFINTLYALKTWDSYACLCSFF